MSQMGRISLIKGLLMKGPMTTLRITETMFVFAANASQASPSPLLELIVCM